MQYGFVTNEIAEELSIDIAPKVTVICDCGTINTYYQDSPGNRCFDPVYCENCGTVIGKT